MAIKICTNCGYEGVAIKRPNDSAGESGNEMKEAFDKLCRLVTVLTFIPVKPLAMLLSVPFYLVMWPIKRLIKGDGKVSCPNCGLPLMVSMKSDAGWLAKRKNDIKAGLVVEKPKEEVVAFGRVVKLPGDDAKKTAPVVAPVPEKLPSLDVLLQEPENTGETVPDTAEEPHEIKPNKPPANPDEW